jgi:hypothetical protein
MWPSIVRKKNVAEEEEVGGGGVTGKEGMW